MTQSKFNEDHKVRRQQLVALQQSIHDLEQQNSDLEIALQTAVEHGDAIDLEMSKINARLLNEVAERVRAEARLEQLLAALQQQKADLEILVTTISEHSDDIDIDWLRRYTLSEANGLIDDLTGIANRRGLNQALDKAYRRGLRTGSPLALVMIDLDYFKSYNDHFGHPAGDACLDLIGQILRHACKRPDDCAARYGGEEFVLVLPNTDIDGATRIIQGIRAELAMRALPHPGSSFGAVTLSMGATSAIPSPDSDVASLLAAADRLLYAAKNDGRNTFRVY